MPQLFDATDPLNPLWHEEHLDFYVPVDNTEESFTTCQKRFEDLADLHRQGRLVLVSGERGCGKTALINRCAYWLHGRLRADGLGVEVVDLTQEASDSATVRERLSKVSEALVDKLDLLALLRGDRIYDKRTDPDGTYRNLPGYLEPDQWLIVLLPTVELVEELRYYDARAPQRTVFFAEAPSAVGVQHVSGRTLHLRVDAFEHEHASLFAADRLGRMPAGAVPPLAPEALDEFIQGDRKTTIREMQWLLFGVYETLRVQNSRPDEVTWEHLGRHFVREARRLRGERP
ncbi:hypothetical protein E1091_03280 [Micromonospora fluostatini]|uniref:ATP-binding protein n=1 Tax=Micromonospora fluostatini TaxID=1629071 RepID=A0ABY2DKJ3_9ACTN|nr:hypothetical protein E1091_03280 [Micromonospora fluostatini]